MTTPKIPTFHKGGSRYYIHPDTGEKAPGVTSVLNMLPKGFLKYWAAKEVATSAVRSLDGSGPDWLTPMVAADPEAAIEFLKKAPDRNTRKAADIGSAAHGFFESMLWGEKLGPLTADLQPFHDQFADLLDKVQPEPVRTEDTVWSTQHSYAGSFDLIARVQGELCVVDAKTTRSGVHAEVSMQLAAYAHADYLLDKKSHETVTLPKVERGLVFHVRPEGWQVMEVPITDEVFEYFLALRKTFDWEQISRKIGKNATVKGDVYADEEAGE